MQFNLPFGFNWTGCEPSVTLPTTSDIKPTYITTILTRKYLMISVLQAWASLLSLTPPVRLPYRVGARACFMSTHRLWVNEQVQLGHIKYVSTKLMRADSNTLQCWKVFPHISLVRMSARISLVGTYLNLKCPSCTCSLTHKDQRVEEMRVDWVWKRICVAVYHAHVGCLPMVLEPIYEAF